MASQGGTEYFTPSRVVSLKYIFYYGRVGGCIHRSWRHPWRVFTMNESSAVIHDPSVILWSAVAILGLVSGFYLIHNPSYTLNRFQEYAVVEV